MPNISDKLKEFFGDPTIPGQAVEEVLMNAKAKGYGPGGDPGYDVETEKHYYMNPVNVTFDENGNFTYEETQPLQELVTAYGNNVLVAIDETILNGTCIYYFGWHVQASDDDYEINFSASEGQGSCAYYAGESHNVSIYFQTETVTTSDNFKKAVRTISNISFVGSIELHPDITADIPANNAIDTNLIPNNSEPLIEEGVIDIDGYFSKGYIAILKEAVFNSRSSTFEVRLTQYTFVTSDPNSGYFRVSIENYGSNTAPYTNILNSMQYSAFVFKVE